MYEVILYNNPHRQQGKVIHTPDSRPIKLTSGTIAQGINVVNSFTAQLNMKNPGYSQIFPHKTWIEVINHKISEVEFYGYALRESYNMDSGGQYTKQVTFVDGLHLFKKSMQKYGEYHDVTPKEFMQIMIDTHNEQVEEYKQFKLGNIEVTNSTDNVYRYLSQEQNTFESIFDKLVDRLGGELRVRHEVDGWYLDWLEETGELKKDTPIKVGKNIQSANRNLNSEGIVTRLYVYGAEIEKEDADLEEGMAYASRERITIAEVNDGKPYLDEPESVAQFGIIAGYVTFDGVSDKNILLSRGKNHLMSLKQVTDTNTVTAFDLAQIDRTIDFYEVGNYYPLDNPGFTAPYNVRIIEKKVDVITPHRSTLTIGDKGYTSSQYQAEMKKSRREIEQLRGSLENQTRQYVRLQTAYTQINQDLEAVRTTIATTDLDNMPQAMQTINRQLQGIQQGIGALPVYELATHDRSGLMSSQDKVKLDGLESYELATETEAGLISAEDKMKLNGLDLEQISQKLGDLRRRVTELEGAE